MGYYVNPSNGQSKELWLYDNAEEVTLDEAIFLESPGDGLVTLCWVDNGPFTATIICYDNRERDYIVRGFIDGSDTRPYQFYRAPIELVQEFLPNAPAG